MKKPIQKKPSRFDRSNSGLFGRWWWTVDRMLFVTLVLLILCGMILVTAGSPPVAKRLGYDAFHFVYRQQGFLLISFLVMVGVSMFEPKHIRRLSVLGLLGSLALLCVLPIIGEENKGAVRWFPVPFVGTVQPSEFLKPFFAVVVAWVLSERFKNSDFPSYRIAFALFSVSAGLVIIQPDFGMTLTLMGVFGVQLFLAGIPLLLVCGMGVMAVAVAVGAYFAMPHVRDRIETFLNPTAENYQVMKSLQAFQSGGFFGRGPGEGVIKWQIPDSHTDFIFAVAAEEFGVMLSIVLVLMFAFVVLRSFYRAGQMTDTFPMLAVSGLAAQFGGQAFVNMGVSLKLLPAKGMTLPFMSYGGSSLVAMALGMGMLLALTRKRYGQLPSGRLQG
ncbi:MAG: putative lipid II flippase FtsW [Rickettsiales bacterium]|nr:putative lipid II flippase FtsW [Rickettsiales bacterium]